MKPTIAQLAAALIAVFEGPEKLTAYRDSGGVLTIGRGHTGPDVFEGQTITHERAVEMFAADQAPLLAMVGGLPPIAAAAYASFGFNCGPGAVHAVLAGRASITDPIHTEDRHGTVLAGLQSRRRLERLLTECGV